MAWLRRAHGASMGEYAVVVGVVCMGCIPAYALFGETLGNEENGTVAYATCWLQHVRDIEVAREVCGRGAGPDRDPNDPFDVNPEDVTWANPEGTPLDPDAERQAYEDLYGAYALGLGVDLSKVDPRQLQSLIDTFRTDNDLTLYPLDAVLPKDANLKCRAVEAHGVVACARRGSALFPEGEPPANSESGFQYAVSTADDARLYLIGGDEDERPVDQAGPRDRERTARPETREEGRGELRSQGAQTGDVVSSGSGSGAGQSGPSGPGPWRPSTYDADQKDFRNLFRGRGFRHGLALETFYFLRDDVFAPSRIDLGPTHATVQLYPDGPTVGIYLRDYGEGEGGESGKRILMGIPRSVPIRMDESGFFRGDTGIIGRIDQETGEFHLYYEGASRAARKRWADWSNYTSVGGAIVEPFVRGVQRALFEPWTVENHPGGVRTEAFADKVFNRPTYTIRTPPTPQAPEGTSHRNVVAAQIASWRDPLSLIGVEGARPTTGDIPITDSTTVTFSEIGGDSDAVRETRTYKTQQEAEAVARLTKLLSESRPGRYVAETSDPSSARKTVLFHQPAPSLADVSVDRRVLHDQVILERQSILRLLRDLATNQDWFRVTDAGQIIVTVDDQLVHLDVEVEPRFADVLPTYSQTNTARVYSLRYFLRVAPGLATPTETDPIDVEVDAQVMMIVGTDGPVPFERRGMLARESLRSYWNWHEPIGLGDKALVVIREHAGKKIAFYLQLPTDPFALDPSGLTVADMEKAIDEYFPDLARALEPKLPTKPKPYPVRVITRGGELYDIIDGPSRRFQMKVDKHKSYRGTESMGLRLAKQIERAIAEERFSIGASLLDQFAGDSILRNFVLTQYPAKLKVAHSADLNAASVDLGREDVDGMNRFTRVVDLKSFQSDGFGSPHFRKFSPKLFPPALTEPVLYDTILMNPPAMPGTVADPRHVQPHVLRWNQGGGMWGHGVALTGVRGARKHLTQNGNAIISVFCSMDCGVVEAEMQRQFPWEGGVEMYYEEDFPVTQEQAWNWLRRSTERGFSSSGDGSPPLFSFNTTRGVWTNRWRVYILRMPDAAAALP